MAMRPAMSSAEGTERVMDAEDLDALCRIDGCDTLSALFRKRVLEHPGEVALREKDLGIWNEYT
ncbi:MAG: hypothetical protein AAFY88_21065, partial [Acidobacteriota bacterium]